MKNTFLSFLLLGITCTGIYAQTIPAGRKVKWENAGFPNKVPSFNKTINILQHGANASGTSDNSTALQHAIEALNGKSGVVYFPKGIYKFAQTINLTDSVVLKGAGADSSVLLFDLGGAAANCINVYGSELALKSKVTAALYKDSSSIIIDNVVAWQANDEFILYQNDKALVTSSWAYNSVGQIMRIKKIEGNKIIPDCPLRKSYETSDSVVIVKRKPCTYAGIECLRIKRLDKTSTQTSNVDFDKASYCWMIGVRSDSANYAHVTASRSSHIYISGCYMHHAFGYGSGGKAYGVCLQFTSGDCLIENNIFYHLRHSMLLQAGANGNVFVYNSSSDPYWVEGIFPSNSAGDIVLHGNYPYANLFEGNDAQNLVIDNSHGKNGPYNTFFRNRLGTWGIFMNSNPASNDQNFIGNEITNTIAGMYSISGTGHLEYNNNLKGSIIPEATANLPVLSYFSGSKPEYYSSVIWPSFGPPSAYNTGTVPATERLKNKIYTDCKGYSHEQNTVGVKAQSKNKSELKVYPNPVHHHEKLHVEITGEEAVKKTAIFDTRGNKIWHCVSKEKSDIITDHWAPGIYIVKVVFADGHVLAKQFVLSK